MESPAAALPQPAGALGPAPGRRDRGDSICVAVEMTLLELNRTGTARAATELVAALQAIDGLDLVPVAHARMGRMPSGRIRRGLAREALWLSRGVTRVAAAHGADVLHLPTTLSIPLAGRTPLVMTVHDTFPWDEPSWGSRSLRVQHRLRVGPSLGRVACFVVPSAWTANRVIERLGVDPEAIVLAPHGVGPQFAPGAADGDALDRLGVRGPYLLGVNSTVRRKGLRDLLDAFDRLADAERPHDLVLVGGDGPRDRGVDARIEALGTRVRRTGWVSDADLVELYRGADAFVFPTLGEGFGFPVAEAMACGAPVVATEVASIPEVAGDAAVLVPPGDPALLADALERVLDQPELRTRLVERGLEQVAPLTWERSARLTAEAYRRALERSA